MTTVQIYNSARSEVENRDGISPLISVVIPTRNRANLLQRSVNSVLNQTYRKIELIVVDDASTDNTAEMLKSIADHRLTVISRDKNQGAAASRNLGISRATGEYIAFHDDDDIWLLEKLEKQVRALCNTRDEPALCICGYVEISDDHTRYIGGTKFADGLDFDRGNGMGGPDYSLIATPGWVVKKSRLENVGGFDERMQSWDDWELALRLTINDSILLVDEPLYIKDHVQGKGLMLNHLGRVSDLEIIMEKHADLWAESPEVQRRHHYHIGRTRFLLDPTPGAGRKDLRAALNIPPFRAKTALLYLLTFLSKSAGLRLFNFYSRIMYPRYYVSSKRRDPA